MDSQYGPSENVSTMNRLEASQMAYPTADWFGVPVKENRNPPLVAFPEAEIAALPADRNGVHHAERFTVADATPLPPAVMLVMLEYVIVAVRVSAELMRLAVIAAPPFIPESRIFCSPALVMMYAISLSSCGL